jgi:hypothetical protein
MPFSLERIAEALGTMVGFGRRFGVKRGSFWAEIMPIRRPLTLITASIF